MPNLVEHLKVAENSVKKGLKKGAWFPHESFEKGTRTLAYGHKLSKAEDKGNYVVLPDGTVHDFDNGGISEDVAMQLLMADIKTHGNLAKIQWDKANKDKSFDSLDSVHKDLLTEISFNVGGLSNKSGKFGWAKLAKAIKADDVEGIKEESKRTAVGKPLTTRNKQVADFIDNYEPMSAPVTEGNVEAGVIASIRRQMIEQGGLEQDKLPTTTANTNASQNGSQELTEGLTAEEATELDMLEKKYKDSGLGTSTDRVSTESNLTPEEELELIELEKKFELGVKYDGPAAEPKRDLVQEIYG